jgi:UDP-N-acetylglucosamine 2-epimerase (non-hydrolysing)
MQETTYLGTPCLTARPPLAERPVTITHGANRLVSGLAAAAREALAAAATRQAPTSRPALWDGRAAVRVVDAVG